MQTLRVWYHALLEVEVCLCVFFPSPSSGARTVPALYFKEGNNWSVGSLKTSEILILSNLLLFFISHCCYDKASLCNEMLAFYWKCFFVCFFYQEQTINTEWNVHVSRHIVTLKKLACGSVGLLPIFCPVTALHNKYSLVTWPNGCPASRWPNHMDFIFERDVKGTFAFIKLKQGWWHFQALLCFEVHSTDIQELHTLSHSADDCELFEPREPCFERLFTGMFTFINQKSTLGYLMWMFLFPP